jgi:hypothetical protein
MHSTGLVVAVEHRDLGRLLVEPPQCPVARHCQLARIVADDCRSAKLTQRREIDPDGRLVSAHDDISDPVAKQDVQLAVAACSKGESALRRREGLVVQAQYGPPITIDNERVARSVHNVDRSAIARRRNLNFR